MRIFVLLALGVAALDPASAAPLSIKKDVAVVPGTPMQEFAVNGPPKAGLNPTTANQIKEMTDLPVLRRRGTSFRQADYGVSPFRALLPVPVADVAATSTAATPSATVTSSHVVRSDLGVDSLFANRPAKDSSAQDLDSPAPPPRPSLHDVPHFASSKTGTPPSFGSVSDSASSADPDAPHKNAGAKPDLSPAFNAAMAGSHGAMSSRYQAADLANSAFSSFSENPVIPDETADRMTAMRNNMQTGSKSKSKSKLWRRVLRPSSYIAGRFARFARALVQPHTFEVNTETLLPQRPDPSLNRSDPHAMAQEQQRKRIGLVNIDSNRPAPPPPQVPKVLDENNGGKVADIPDSASKSEGISQSGSKVEDIEDGASKVEDIQENKSKSDGIPDSASKVEDLRESTTSGA